MGTFVQQCTVIKVVQKMINKSNGQPEPLCKFGPGGDFVRAWPALTYKVQKSPVAKLIDSLGEITAAITASGPNISTEESFLYADKANDDQPAHTPPITAIKGDSIFPGQPLLFPDDFRIGRNFKHQSKHRIRTYRRAAKKESAVSLPGQSSLFAADLRSARSA
jgi:hypothetical protein